MSYYKQMMDYIENFKKNEAKTHTMPYDINSHTLSRHAEDRLIDEFQDYYMMQDGKNLSEKTVFDMIRNAYMLDYYDRAFGETFVTLEAITKLMSAQAVIDVSDENEELLYRGTVNMLPEVLRNAVVMSTEANDYKITLITVCISRECVDYEYRIRKSAVNEFAKKLKTQLNSCENNTEIIKLIDTISKETYETLSRNNR